MEKKMDKFAVVLNPKYKFGVSIEREGSEDYTNKHIFEGSYQECKNWCWKHIFNIDVKGENND